MKDIAIYGAGGYGNELACLLHSINTINPVWNIIGFFDDGKPIGKEERYGKILGGLDRLNAYNNSLAVVFAIGNPNTLLYLTERITNPNIYYPNIIAPDVVFHDRYTVSFGKGNIIFYQSIISFGVQFGNFNLLNNGVYVGHETVIQSYNVINPATRISGNVKMGDSNFVGVSSVILQGLTIGNNTSISAGSCLFRDTKDNNLYAGNPAVIKLVPRI